MKPDKILIKVKAFGLTQMAELPHYAKADEFMDTFAKLATAIGYPPEVVLDALKLAVKARE